ncbi:MAG: response regulator transcription factor [Spirochaetota bacterium]|nr:response regulator transcription factor [Spirochaetota bacterium]
MITKNSKIRLAIVDDEITYRDYVKLLLESEPRIHLYGEYDRGMDFLQSLNSPFKPDVCLMDVMLSDMNGLECSKLAKQIIPSLSIIIMTSQPNHKGLVDAKSFGADYIEKGTMGEMLIDKIILNQHLDKNEQLISLKNSIKNDHNKMLLLQKEIENIQELVVTLTKGQRDVLLLVQAGKSKHEIAELLSLSAKTIQNHINRAEDKLKLKVFDNLFKYIDLG